MPRPEPAPELSQEEAEEWRLIVERLPADWFPYETQGLLAQYCRHRVRARRVAQLVADMEASEDFDAKEYAKLLQMEEVQSRTMATLATRMRMTQHSTYDAKKSKPIKGARKPWEDKD